MKKTIVLLIIGLLLGQGFSLAGDLSPVIMKNYSVLHAVAEKLVDMTKGGDSGLEKVVQVLSAYEEQYGGDREKREILRYLQIEVLHEFYGRKDTAYGAYSDTKEKSPYWQTTQTQMNRLQEQGVNNITNLIPSFSDEDETMMVVGVDCNVVEDNVYLGVYTACETYQYVGYHIGEMIESFDVSGRRNYAQRIAYDSNNQRAIIRMAGGVFEPTLPIDVIEREALGEYPQQGQKHLVSWDSIGLKEPTNKSHARDGIGGASVYYLFKERLIVVVPRFSEIKEDLFIVTIDLTSEVLIPVVETW